MRNDCEIIEKEIKTEQLVNMIKSAVVKINDSTTEKQMMPMLDASVSGMGDNKHTVFVMLYVP